MSAPRTAAGDGQGKGGAGHGASREEVRASRPTPPGLVVGLRASAEADVTDADTAAALGSGDVPVLGTPRLLALAEAACLAAIAPVLPGGQTTVGTAMSLEHKRPSHIGARIQVEAELTEISGRRLVFVFIAYGEGAGEEAVIGSGSVERVLVDTARFLAGSGAGGGAN